jgi:hypothetical protein
MLQRLPPPAAPSSEDYLFGSGFAGLGRAWVDKNHPGDAGAFVQYVPCVQGPRIYANHRRLAYVR